MAGKEARCTESRLAFHLASKWNRPKSQLVGFVRGRLALAIAWANSLLIRGSRNRGGLVRANIADGTALQHAWQCWQERYAMCLSSVFLLLSKKTPDYNAANARQMQRSKVN